MADVTVCHIADGINPHSERLKKRLILEITNTYKVTNGCRVTLQESSIFHNITQAPKLLGILYIGVVIYCDDVCFFFWELCLPAEVPEADWDRELHKIMPYFALHIITLSLKISNLRSIFYKSPSEFSNFFQGKRSRIELAK